MIWSVDYVDSSGMRFTYTDTLRRYDAAVVGIGVQETSYQLIPPHEKLFVSTAYCPADCINSVSCSDILHWYICNMKSIQDCNCIVIKKSLTSINLWMKRMEKSSFYTILNVFCFPFKIKGSSREEERHNCVCSMAARASSRQGDQNEALQQWNRATPSGGR